MIKAEPEMKDELIAAYISFVRELNFKYPNVSFILNRAFNTYNAGLAEYVNGLMYEGFNHDDFEKEETRSFYYDQLINPLIKTAEEKDGVILALSYTNEKANYKLAQDFNFLYFYYQPDEKKNLGKELQNISIEKRN